MAARTAVVERIKLKLLQPFAFLFGVGREYFEVLFRRKWRLSLPMFLPENIRNSFSTVARPTLLALSYTHSEPSLKDMISTSWRQQVTIGGQAKLILLLLRSSSSCLRTRRKY